MKTGRHKLKDAVDCLGFGIGADLEELVIIGEFHFHPNFKDALQS
jgi:hypothetical protein